MKRKVTIVLLFILALGGLDALVIYGIIFSNNIITLDDKFKPLLIVPLFWINAIIVDTFLKIFNNKLGE